MQFQENEWKEIKFTRWPPSSCSFEVDLTNLLMQSCSVFVAWVSLSIKLTNLCCASSCRTKSESLTTGMRSVVQNCVWIMGDNKERKVSSLKDMIHQERDMPTIICLKFILIEASTSHLFPSCQSSMREKRSSSFDSICVTAMRVRWTQNVPFLADTKLGWKEKRCEMRIKRTNHDETLLPRVFVVSWTHFLWCVCFPTMTRIVGLVLSVSFRGVLWSPSSLISWWSDSGGDDQRYKTKSKRRET